jgi:hypothetical protein
VLLPGMTYKQVRHVWNMIISIGLLTCLFLLSACQQTPQANTTLALAPQPTQAIVASNTAFVPAGAAMWILSCSDGWQKAKIYQSNPTYTNQQGTTRARDLYVFGSFWLQPNNGTLWEFHDQPNELSCLTDLLTTAHTLYHARVCGVISVDETGVETGKKWQGSDVAAYTQRAVAQPALLTSLVESVRHSPYDCLINDLEDGYNTHPEIFSQYDALLQSRLPIPLGQTLLWKTQAVSSYWQKWEDWSALAEHTAFCIIMALDHDSLYSPPVPASIVDTNWVGQIYAYMRSLPHVWHPGALAWEFPTYYRLFTHRQDGSWAVSAGTDTQAQITLALSTGRAIRQNQLLDAHDPFLEYTNKHGQDSYLFVETARSSDALARLLMGYNSSGCLLASFWDNDSGTSNTLGWSTLAQDQQIRLC